jgi:oligopeptide/dipeptide ABC transporter ATP-binding protein
VSDALLQLDGVSTELLHDGEPQPVLRDVSFDLDRGEVLGLVGESGAGKSMTARTVLRLLPSGARTSGTVRFDGADVPLEGRALRELRARRVGMIFQDPRAHVDPLYRCEDHVTEAIRSLHGTSRRAAHIRAVELMSSVGIADPERVLRAYPGQLSGGMLQRVMIAGVLAQGPELVIADEPTTALDVTIQAEILAIFDRLRRQQEVAILFITHDFDVAAALCDRVLVMYAGRVVEEQPTLALFGTPMHPYTAALLRSRPQLETRAEQLATIPGRPTSAYEAPEGCAFAPRCPFAEPECTAHTPAPRPVGPRARSACRRMPELAPRLREDTAAGVKAGSA